jgi:glycine/D-amino acid oxidase-like deaminating enzyme
MEVDYILIGHGIAGAVLAQNLIERGLSVMIIDQPQQSQASHIASGIWNPLVLKRMKKVWQAEAMLNYLPSFYLNAEKRYSTSIVGEQQVYRVFASPKEVDEWLIKCDDPEFSHLLDENIEKDLSKNIQAPFGYGRVLKSGRIDTSTWLTASRQYFESQRMLRNAHFNIQEVKHLKHGVVYEDLTARGIILCEGMRAAIENTSSKHLPFALTKGEVLTIYAPELNINEIINSSIFILPLGNHHYKVGATYDWDDLTTRPSQTAKNELIKKAEKIIRVPYTVVKHEAGIRPTVKDRKPLLGTLDQKNIHIFNGLGSRGVLMAPWLANVFINYLEEQLPLPPEINIARFG